MLALYFITRRADDYFLKNIYLRFQRRSRKLQLSKVCSKKVPKMTKLTNSTRFFMLLKRLENGRRTLEDLVTGPYVDRYKFCVQI